MQSKPQIIDQISQINASADRRWLESFDLPALYLYLANLRRTLEPRGGHSFWVRRGDTPAVVTRRPAA